GERGERDAAAARKVEDDLVGEGVRHAPREVEAAAVALAEDRLAALQVEDAAFEREAAAFFVDLAEQQHLVAEGAVLLEVVRRVAGELRRGELGRALDDEDAGALEVGAHGALELRRRLPRRRRQHAAHLEAGRRELELRYLAGTDVVRQVGSRRGGCAGGWARLRRRRSDGGRRLRPDERRDEQGDGGNRTA